MVTDKQIRRLMKLLQTKKPLAAAKAGEELFVTHRFCLACDWLKQRGRYQLVKEYLETLHLGA